MNWQKLSHLSKEEIVKLQDKRIAYFFQHELPYSPFYRKLFADNNLEFSDIRNASDLKKIPFSSKQELAPTESEPARPRQFILQPDEHLIKKHASKGLLLKLIWGKLLHQDVKRKLEWLYKPIHTHFTTGRTALPTAFVYPACDVEMMREAGERMLDVAKVSRDWVAINAFPDDQHPDRRRENNGYPENNGRDRAAESRPGRFYPRLWLSSIARSGKTA